MEKENIAVTVNQVSQYLKNKITSDLNLQNIIITGEISNFRERPNSHQYFSLKDSEAKINIVMFKSSFQKVKFKMKDGDKINIYGSLDVYPKGGGYQFYARSIQKVGLGQLFQEYQLRIETLKNEGVIGKEKKEIPFFPKRIAVITSKTGSVIKDILVTIKRRFPNILVDIYPTQVQGESAAPQIINQLKLADSRNYDTLILARGGGSFEDLFVFNDINLAINISELKTPIISSIGHETDTTISDLVSDLRAPTPTAAAELATPNLNALNSDLNSAVSRLINFKNKYINNLNNEVTSLTNSPFLKNPLFYFSNKKDEINNNEKNIINFSLNMVRNNINKLNNLERQLIKNSLYNLSDLKNKLDKEMLSIELLNPEKLLSSGYAFVTDDKNNVIDSIKKIKVGEPIKISMSDGVIDATIIKKGKK